MPSPPAGEARLQPPVPDERAGGGSATRWSGAMPRDNLSQIRSGARGFRPGLQEHVRIGGSLGDFGIDTRVTGAHGRYRATLNEDWRIRGPNGGYVAAIALRAAGAEAAIRRPNSIHVHFLRAAEFAEVSIEVTPLARGRRAESFRVEITQHGKAIAEAMVRTAAEVEGVTHDDTGPLEVSLPEHLPTRAELLAGSTRPRHAFWENFDDIRGVDAAVYADDRTGLPPRFREWYRVRCAEGFDDPFLDAARSLLLIDTLSWPAAEVPHPHAPYVTVSLDVSAWFHQGAPDDPWLYAEGHAPIAREGCIGAHARTYDRRGRLLASGGGQQLCVPAHQAEANSRR